MPKSIFSASFEESKKVVNENITKPEGTGIMYASSMEPEAKTMILIVFGIFSGIILYGVGISLPEELIKSTAENTNVISVQSAIFIGKIGIFLKPIVITLMAICGGMLILNFVPKKNYAHQLAYGFFMMILLLICVLVASVPLAIGVTIDGTGILGFISQLILGFIIVRENIRQDVNEYKEILWGKKDGQEKIKRSMDITKYLNKVLGVLLVFSIINRRFIHLGGDIGNSGFFGIIIGFTTIFIFVVASFFIGLIFPYFMNMFYFVKYSDQYYELFNIPDEIWYGKTKTALMVRQREAKKVREAKEAAEKNSKEI